MPVTGPQIRCFYRLFWKNRSWGDSDLCVAREGAGTRRVRGAVGHRRWHLRGLPADATSLPAARLPWCPEPLSGCLKSLPRCQEPIPWRSEPTPGCLEPMLGCPELTSDARSSLRDAPQPLRRCPACPGSRSGRSGWVRCGRRRAGALPRRAETETFNP